MKFRDAGFEVKSEDYQPLIFSSKFKRPDIQID